MTPMILQRNPALTISKTEFFPVPKPRASVGLAVKGSANDFCDRLLQKFIVKPSLMEA